MWVYIKHMNEWIGLTMVGVRRSSCRPSPPRITVLPVSIMTTLESRKPMLLMLIFFLLLCVLRVDIDAFGDVFALGLGLGFRAGIHKHQQQS